jgi:cytochrome c oxidase subunit 1
MPRRTFTYDPNLGWNTPNMIATLGSYVLGLGIFIYFAVMVYTYFRGEKVKQDYWDGRTLEWSIPNPPPEYNFRVIPTVHARDAFWYEKHHKEEIEKEKAEHAQAEASHGGIHMPFQSIWPLITSLGILIGAWGVSGIYADPSPGIHAKLGTCLVGGAIMIIAAYLWALEGNEGYHLHLDESDHGEAPKPTSPETAGRHH